MANVVFSDGEGLLIDEIDALGDVPPDFFNTGGSDE